MEARMIEDGHIDHEQLLRLGKVLLLLVEREDLLVRLPVVYQLTQKSLPIEDLNRAS
jgi:Trp operon repressor